MALAKSWRVKTKTDIDKLLRSRLSIFSPNYRIKGRKTTKSSFRVAVVIPKKKIKKSVKRHHLQRKILAVLEKYKSQKRLPANFDCLVILSSKKYHQTFAEIEKELIPNLKKLFFKLFSE